MKGTVALAVSAIGTAKLGRAAAPTGDVPARALAPPAASLRAATSPAPASPVPGRLVGYVFNAKTRDVTLFDPETRTVLETKPLGAVVRWLSNEQRFWDGRHIWTYDFPEDTVQAIVIDPHRISIARTLPTHGTGPAHSLMLSPDLTSAWLNVAGDDYLAVLDTASGEVTAEIATGKFP